MAFSPGNRPGTTTGGGGSNLGQRLSPPIAPKPAPTTGVQPLLHSGTPFMGGVDMTKPGVAETYFNKNASKFTGPTLGSTFYKENQKAFTTPGLAETYGKNAVDAYGNGKNPQVSNNSQSFLDTTYGQDKTNLSADPNFADYYANAGRQATEGIDKAMAAQGMYGSSARNDQVSEALGNLAADRAKNEAQYNLNRSADARGWDQLGGSLAGQADTVSNMASQNNLSWMQGLGQLAGQSETEGLARLGLGGNLAQGADSGNLSWLNSGMNAAGQAQDAARNRGQDAFNNTMRYGEDMSNLMGQDYGGMFSSDQNSWNAAMGLTSAADTTAQDIERMKEQRVNDESPWKQILGGTSGGGGGGGGGGIMGLISGIL